MSPEQALGYASALPLEAADLEADALETMAEAYAATAPHLLFPRAVARPALCLIVRRFEAAVQASGPRPGQAPGYVSGPAAIEIPFAYRDAQERAAYLSWLRDFGARDDALVAAMLRDCIPALMTVVARLPVTVARPLGYRLWFAARKAGGFGELVEVKNCQRSAFSMMGL